MKLRSTTLRLDDNGTRKASARIAEAYVRRLVQRF